MDHISERVSVGSSEYQEVGRDPHSWLQSATYLKSAADLIAVELKGMIADRLRGKRWTERTLLYYPFMMLNGLAAENVIKGLLVGRNPGAVATDKMVSFKSHHLSGLARSLGIPLSDAETGLLDRLQVYVQWAGRYPIPSQAQGFNRPEFPTSDIEAVDQLLVRLRELLCIEFPNPGFEFV